MTAPAAEATPTTDTPTEASPFRWRLAHRPDVRFGHAAGGVAGILAAAAVVAFVVAATGDDARFTGSGFTLALIVAALAAGWRVRGPVRSAAVAAIATAIPLLWVFAVFGDGEGFGRSEIRLVFLLSLASYVVFYLLTWTRGRAVLLGLALLVGTSWIVFEVTKQDVPFTSNLIGQVPVSGFGQPASAFGGGDRTTEAAIAQILIAVVLLGVGVVLDRRRRFGAATPCLLVGGLYAVNGAITLGGDVDDVYAAGVFVAIAGLAIGLAGSLGKRRGTSWIGAIVLLAGAITVIAQGTQDTATSGDGTAIRFGIYALLGAAVLLTAGIIVARTLAEPIDGGEPFTPPPAPDPVPEPTPDPAPAPAPAPDTTEATVVDAPATPEPGPETSPEPAPDPPPPVTWAAPEPSPPAPETPPDE